MCASVVNIKHKIYILKQKLVNLCLRKTKFLVLEQLVPGKWQTFGLH